MKEDNGSGASFTVKNKSNGVTKKIAIFVSLFCVFSFGWLLGDDRITLGTSPKTLLSGSSQLDSGASSESLEEIYRLLGKNFDGDIDRVKFEEGMKKGAVSAVGDNYTEYFTPEEAKQFNADLEGEFEGIGAELSKESGYIVVVAPIKGAPAEKAGLLPKDVIVKIDDEEATDISVSEAVDKIRGEKGTSVKIGIIRDGEELEFTIVRDTIDIPSVEWRIVDNVGIIEISRFGDDTTDLARKAATEISDKNIKKVVLDMRGNPGGLLDEAVGIAGIWLDKGATVLEEKRGEEVIKRFTTSESPILNGSETVILINAGSASASEIVAGALSDNDAATLIGEISYGKGSVQQLINLSNGGALKVTIARWFTPKGKNIDKEGIAPDKEVKMTADDRLAKKDPQLDAALKSLK